MDGRLDCPSTHHNCIDSQDRSTRCRQCVNVPEGQENRLAHAVMANPGKLQAVARRCSETTSAMDEKIDWEHDKAADNERRSREPDNANQLAAPVGGPKLSIIVPTYNERDNVAELVQRLRKCLDGHSWEAIIVDDDSSDGTAQIIRDIAKNDSRVRCIQRIGRRGLSSACIEGMLASSADFVAVIDADMQHDEKLLPQMISALEADQIDVVIGSRYVEGGGIRDWDQIRSLLSRLATRLSCFVTKANLTDPLSGFFMIRREVMLASAHNLSGVGFKILLDIFASSSTILKFKELPYQFGEREFGESKLDALVAWNFLIFLTSKYLGDFIPARFLSFGIIGGLGVLVHLSVLTFFFHALKIAFVNSQIIATFLAMIFNYTLNNILTYSDFRIRGRNWFIGLLSFMLICSVGALANVGIAAYLFQMETGWILSALAGIFVGSVWNYAVSMHYTWHGD